MAHSKNDLVEYATAVSITLRDDCSRSVYFSMDGSLRNYGWRTGGRGAYSVLKKVSIWDGHRRLCAPGAHGSGQRGVRVEAIMSAIESIDIGLFDERLDAIRLTKKNDMLTIEHVRFGR